MSECIPLSKVSSLFQCDAVELDVFLARYPDSCPALHHSVTYRLAYAPAYRIVAQKKLKAYLAGRRNMSE